MAIKPLKPSHVHTMRIPLDLYKWLMAQKQSPSETLSMAILRILWNVKISTTPNKKSK